MLLTLLSCWNRASKDVFTNYAEILSNYVNIICNYAEIITIMCLRRYSAVHRVKRTYFLLRGHDYNHLNILQLCILTQLSRQPCESEVRNYNVVHISTMICF